MDNSREKEVEIQADYLYDKSSRDVFRKPNVFVCPTGKLDEKAIGGILSLNLKPDGECTLVWMSYATAAKNSTPLTLSTPFVDLATGEKIPSGTTSRTSSSEPPPNKNLESTSRQSSLETYEITIPLKQIRSIKKYIPALGTGTPYIIVQTSQDAFLPPLFFQAGGVKEFFKVLKEYVSVTQSADDPNVAYLNDLSSPLARSLSVLDGLPDTISNTSSPYEHESFLHSLGMAFLGKLSKVPKMGRQALKKVMEPKKEEDILSKPSAVHYTLGSFELVQQDDELILPQVTREEPLSPEEWYAAFDEEGRIKDPTQIKNRIFKGGCDPSIRNEAWKFLLGYYPWTSTAKERADIREAKAKEYSIYKMQWQSITKQQEARFSKFRSRKNRIEKDVIRTDRELEQYKSRESVGLSVLHDILVTYAFYNFDLGYVQGMNDLLSPIYLVMKDEVDAFWCFAGYMDVMESNFHKDQNGMSTQFYQLEKLLETVDPELHAYFKEQNCLNLYFCYRWLLVNFKREFSVDAIQRVWEVIWANPLHPRFHLFIAVAILVQHRSEIMNRRLGFDQMLKYINDMAGKMDPEEVLRRGEALYKLFDITTDDDVKASIFQFKPAPPKRK